MTNRQTARSAHDLGTKSPRRFAFSLEIATLAIVFVIVAGFLLTGSSPSNEFAALQAVSRAHTPVLDWLSLAINWLFGPPMAVIVTLVAAVSVYLRFRNPRHSVRLLALIVIPWLGTDFIKVLVRRTRPDVADLAHHLVPAPASFSYPSGHTSFATSLGLAVVILIGKHHLRRLSIAAAAIIAVGTAASRVYLGVHYPTDVIAALIYTTAAIILVDALWRRLTADRPLWR